MRLPKWLLATAALTFAPALAHAANGPNLVTNGGFETGDFTGFTQGGNTDFTSVSTDYASSGTYGARLGPVGSDGTLSQTLATTMGDTYQLTYDHSYPGGTPSDFSVTFGGQTFDATTNATTPTSYTTYTHDIVATSTSTLLEFSFRNDPSYQGLDNIAVVDLGATGSVSAAPEPGVWALMLGGIGILGAMMRVAHARRREDEMKSIATA